MAMSYNQSNDSLSSSIREKASVYIAKESPGLIKIIVNSTYSIIKSLVNLISEMLRQATGK
jgi:hypothetical protein